jgi:transposase-like protein
MKAVQEIPAVPAILSPVQAQVVAVLAQGRTVTDAAREAGVHRNTIHNWMQNEPEFKIAIEEAQGEYLAVLRDGMRDLAARAIETLRSLLDDPKTPPAVRLRTALAILERPHFPDPGWHLPERIQPTREQLVIDQITEIKKDHHVMRMTDALEASAKRKEPARCAPCPCGSGIKYKRCCLGKKIAA